MQDARAANTDAASSAAEVKAAGRKLAHPSPLGVPSAAIARQDRGWVEGSRGLGDGEARPQILKLWRDAHFDLPRHSARRGWRCVGGKCPLTSWSTP